MKNISVILNVLLLLLVGVLFYLHFSGKKGNGITPQIIKADGKTVSVPQIAYVDMDSFSTHYEYFKIKKAEVQAAQTAMEDELQRKASAFQSKYQAFMQKAETMTEEEGMAAQQQLAQEKEALDMLMQRNDETIMKKSTDFNNQIREDVIKFLKKYNADGRFSYIMPYSKDQINLLYVNEAYNITDDVIQGMNEEYKANKK